MEKAPIKRNPNIVKLSQDHHASLLFCWKLRQGLKYHAEPSRMIKYVKYFWEHHFSNHFKEEEDILFAPLKDTLIEKAIEDHTRIKKFIGELTSAPQPDQDDQLSVLADTVDAHVRFEERILFPHLEKQLSAEQLEDIGGRISGEPLKDNYDDTFWIKSSSL